MRGRTRWRRFAAAFVPAGLAAGILMAGVANGVVAVPFVVSGDTFKVSANALDGQGFKQYGGVAVDAKGVRHPVAISEIDSATLTNLCQSVAVKGTPLTMLIRAGRPGGKPVTARGMVIGMDHLVGDATFTTIDIGVDESVLTGDPNGAGGFGQRATSVHIDGLKQTAYSTQAGTFVLNGLDLRISFTGEQCFPDLP